MAGFRHECLRKRNIGIFTDNFFRKPRQVEEFCKRLTLLFILGLSQFVHALDNVPVAVSTITADDLAKDSGNAGFYAALSAGAILPSDADVKYNGSSSGTAELSFKNSYLLEGAFGYNFNDAQLLSCAGFPTRIELGLSYLMYDWDTWTEGGITYDESKNSTSFLNVMFNGYWDFHNKSKFTPFLLGGLGFTRADIDHQNNSYDDTVLAGQLGGGVSFAITEKLNFDATYRYFASQDIEFTETSQKTEMENQQHHFLFGARFQF